MRKKCSELESHLDIADHSLEEERRETLYDKLRKDWVERFTTTVSITDKACAPIVANEDESVSPHNSVQMGWALSNPRVVLIKSEAT